MQLFDLLIPVLFAKKNASSVRIKRKKIDKNRKNKKLDKANINEHFEIML